jgi:enoyl-CoA hydratase
MSDPILYETIGKITRITLNRPDCLVSNDMADELARRLPEFETSHLIVLRSAGKDFVAGRDVPPFKGKPTAMDVKRVSTEPPLRVVGAVKRCRVPVLALVTGKAVGLGAALAASCDITFAAEDATFILPEMNHGIPPCLAMSGLLHRVPVKQIAWMTYSTLPIDAQEALRLGLVTKVFPAAQLEEQAASFTARIDGHKQTAMVGVKDFLRSAPSLDVQALSDFASNLLSTIVSSHEAH